MLLVGRQEKTEWWGAGVVICLERGANLHMAQLMPLPLTVSCFNKIQIACTFCLERGANLHMAQLMPLPLTVSCFNKIQIACTFLVPADLGSPGQGPLNGFVVVC